MNWLARLLRIPPKIEPATDPKRDPRLIELRHRQSVVEREIQTSMREKRQ